MPWPPPEVIASWPIPNYTDPATNGLVTVLYVFISIFLFISTVAIAARLFARVWFRNWFGLDDVFIIIAYIAELGVTAALLVGYVRFNWNRHVYDLPLDLIEPSAKILFSLKLIWPIGSCLTRISILFFYYRILDHIQIRKYRWVLHFVMFCVWALLISFTFSTIFDCVPVQNYWAVPPEYNPNARCIDQTAAFTALSAINTFTELIVAILPIPVVLNLKMDARQRWAVIALLSLGIFVSIVGAVRTYYLWMAFSTYDLTWYATPHWIAAVVEIDLAIACACAPALRPLFRGTQFLSRISRLSRRPSETHDEKSRSSTPSRGVLTSRPREGRVHPAVLAKPGALPDIPRADSAQSRLTPRAGSSQSRAISRATSTQSKANRGGRTSAYGSNTSIPRRQASTTPTSSRGRAAAQRSPAAHSRPTVPSGSSRSSITSDEEIAHRKSLEIQISYHDNGSDVRSLHVQRSKKMIQTRDGVSVTTDGSQPVLEDGQSDRTWLATQDNRPVSRLHSRNTHRDIESDDSDDDMSDKDLEKILAAARGVPQALLQVPDGTATTQEEVSLSDFDFEPAAGADENNSPVSPIDSGIASPSRPSEPVITIQEDDSQRPLFVRHSLSTIASSNLLRPQAAVAAAVAAAANANANDNRDSINRSILTYDSRTRSGVFGSGIADIRTATEQVLHPSVVGPNQVEINRRPIQRRRSADQVEWWERYAPPVETAAPQDGTMWSYAFDRVFSRRRNGDNGDTEETPESTTESSQGNLGSQNGRADPHQFINIDIERGLHRRSNLTGTSGLTSPTRSSGLRDSLNRNFRGPGLTWFDDAASI